MPNVSRLWARLLPPRSLWRGGGGRRWGGSGKNGRRWLKEFQPAIGWIALQLVLHASILMVNKEERVGCRR